MKKFHERSRRGQQRIVICAATAVILLIVAGILIFDTKETPIDFIEGLNKVSPIPSSSLDVPGKIPSVVPESRPTDSPVNVSPTPTTSTEVIPVPPEGEIGEEIGIQNLFSCVLNPDYPYGSVASNGASIMDTSIPAIAGIKEQGKNISISEVKAGDIGMYGDFACVCVGLDAEGNAVFAYASPFESKTLPKGGIYLGYSMEQCDSLFYGMYPIPCTSYYEGVHETADSGEIFQKAELYGQTVSMYADELYGVGRLISCKQAEKLMKTVPKELMLEHNVKIVPDELQKFLSEFARYAGAEDFQGQEFCLRVKKRFSLKTGQYIEAELVSLSAENFLSCAGEWQFTVYEANLIPFLDYRLYSYVGMGFAKAQESVYRYDGEGNLSGYEIKDAVEKTDVVVNSDGTQIYKGEGYSMVLDEGESVITEGQNEKIISLGNMQYLLVGNDGSLYTVDMSEFAGIGEEIVMKMLEMQLKELDRNE